MRFTSAVDRPELPFHRGSGIPSPVPRHFLSLRIALLVILAGIVVAAADLTLNGFAVVHDPDDVVAGAVLTNGAQRQPMRNFARGYWAARPRSDGSIRILCRNGEAIERGRVTPGERTTRTVTRDECERALARSRRGA